MAPIKNSSVFIHIDIPGQEANAELLNLGKDAAGNDKKFPTMQAWNSKNFIPHKALQHLL